MLTQQRLKELFTCDLAGGILYWRKDNGRRIHRRSGRIAGTVAKDGYVDIMVEGKLYQRHRLIWLWVYGVFPQKGLDHKDRIPGHDWPENLREATQSQNMQNRSGNRNATSKYKGVSWDTSRQLWTVRIRVNGKNKNLGRFKSEREAYDVYCNAAEKCFGPFAASRLLD